MTDRETVRCVVCELMQFRTADGACRRCKRSLPTGVIQATSVVVVAVPDTRVLPMREVIQRAALQAHRLCGGTMAAAKALGISTNRLKQLMRDGGDHTDYRKFPTASRQAA